MSQRASGYQRKELDAYDTPAWVTEVLRPHIDLGKEVWEPACGRGAMADVIRKWGVTVYCTDIHHIAGNDFLSQGSWWFRFMRGAIITNPPYFLAQAFIEHALHLTNLTKGSVAMLLRTDYDHARTRQHLFGECPQFMKKVVLTKRIVWFNRPGAAPSFNHAWYIWDWMHDGPPTIAYEPKDSK